MSEGRKERGPQSTHWCFTVHNHSCLLLELPPGVQYIVYQEELPPSNAIHIQGYVQFEKKLRGSTVTALTKEWFEPYEGDPHTEPAKGSDEDNQTYCTKEETRLSGPYHFGVRVPHAGKKGGRSDLLAIQRKIQEGATMKRIFVEHFDSAVKFSRGIREYKNLVDAPRNDRPEIYVIIGPTGNEKTRLAYQMAGQDYYSYDLINWWDGYDGQKTVVMDEYYGHKMAFTQLLRVLDWYPLRVPTKGGSVQLQAHTFIITSNQDPQDWYNSEKTHQTVWADNPLKRRLDEFGEIIYVGGFVRQVPEIVQGQFGFPIRD